MKKVIKTIMILILAGIMWPGTAAAESETFGPDEWQQYRLHSDKNAVFDNGSEPLEYQTFETSDEIRSTPVVVGDRLFVGNHNTGDLWAFDITTGETLWENQAPNWVHSEMIYQDGRVFVGFGNRYTQDNGIRGTGESGVMALDADSGDRLWTYPTEGEVMPTPAYHGGSVYITTGDGHIYQLEPETGDLERQVNLNSRVSMSSPNVTEDTLYVGGSLPYPYNFTAYNLTDGTIKWQTDFPDVIAGLDDVPPATSDDYVVTTALTGDKEDPEHWLYAIDQVTGERVWEEQLGTGDYVKNNKSGAPIIADGTIFVGSPITEEFYAYDLETGEEKWHFDSGLMKAPPVATDGTVYLSNAEGMIYALDAETGEQTGEKELNGTLAPSGPIIMNDTLIVGSQDSNVYTVPLTDILDEEGSSEAEEGSNQVAPSEDKSEDSATTQYVIVGVLALILVILLVLMVRRKRS